MKISLAVALASLAVSAPVRAQDFADARMGEAVAGIHAFTRQLALVNTLATRIADSKEDENDRMLAAKAFVALTRDGKTDAGKAIVTETLVSLFKKPASSKHGYALKIVAAEAMTRLAVAGHADADQVVRVMASQAEDDSIDIVQDSIVKSLGTLAKESAASSGAVAALISFVEKPNTPAESYRLRDGAAGDLVSLVKAGKVDRDAVFAAFGRVAANHEDPFRTQILRHVTKL